MNWKLSKYCTTADVYKRQLMNLLPAGMFGSRVGSGFTHFFMLGLAGIITAVALVLPGISVSYMLLMLGMYEDTMYAVSYTHLTPISPLATIMPSDTSMISSMFFTPCKFSIFDIILMLSQ